MADEFQKLLDALADRSISDEQFVRLEKLIAEDALLRKRFLDFQNLCGSLEQWALREADSDGAFERQAILAGETPSEIFKSDDLGAVTRGRRTGDLRWRFLRSLGWMEHAAIVVLLAATAALTVMFLHSRGEHRPGSAEVAPSPKRDGIEDGSATRPLAKEPVARVIEGAGFAFADQDVELGGALSQGSYELVRDAVTLRFRSGVELSLAAPSKFDIVSDMKVALHLGNARAHVSQRGRGFRVIAPELDVEDLGTEFGIVVEHNRATQVATAVRGTWAMGNDRTHDPVAARLVTTIRQTGNA